MVPPPLGANLDLSPSTTSLQALAQDDPVPSSGSVMESTYAGETALRKRHETGTLSSCTGHPVCT
jgi:hypothetical protein